MFLLGSECDLTVGRVHARCCMAGRWNWLGYRSRDVIAGWVRYTEEAGKDWPRIERYQLAFAGWASKFYSVQ